MKNLALILLTVALVGCSSTPLKETTTPSPATPPAPEIKVPAGCEAILRTMGPGCPKPGQYGAVDLVARVDQKFLEAMACAGIRTVIKYYDYEGNETIRGKIPNAAELAALKAAGFAFMGVFQHNNNNPATFTTARGKADAAEALRLASKWGQPDGSAIYFGADGDFAPSLVLPYFQAAAPAIRAAGYRVGVYGSGGVCKALKKAGLVDGELCMVAASSWAWNGTKAILAEGKGFALKQKVDIRGNQNCLGRSLDYNEVLLADFGQWAIP